MISPTAPISITAVGTAATVDRALEVARDLVARGDSVRILAFGDFASRIAPSGAQLCVAPGDLSGYEAGGHGSIAALRYLASGVPGMAMTLDQLLRDSRMIIMCDASPLVPSIAEAHSFPITRVSGTGDELGLGLRGVKGWRESIRIWRAIRGAVNDMRMFLGLPDFSAPSSFRRSLTRIPILDLDTLSPMLTNDAVGRARLAPAVVRPGRRS